MINAHNYELKVQTQNHFYLFESHLSKVLAPAVQQQAQRIYLGTQMFPTALKDHLLDLSIDLFLHFKSINRFFGGVISFKAQDLVCVCSPFLCVLLPAAGS